MKPKNVDTSVGADHYRPFDITVAWDPIRSESLVTDLGKKLGLKGIATLAFDIQTDRKDIFLLSARLALQGPNPIPKEDKKYVAQNMGNGYYYGQVFTDVNFRIPRPALIGQYYNIKKAAKKDVVRTGGLYQQTVTSKQGADIGLDPSGLETIVALLTEKTFDTIQESIEKAASKYRKK